MKRPELDYKALFDAFQADVTVPISEDAVRMLLDAGEYMRIPKKKVIVEEGLVNPDIYITLSGVNRIAYFDGTKEVTFGFGGVGSVFISPLSFVHNHPALFSLISVNDCEMLRIPKARFNELLKDSHDLSYWMFHLAMSQMDNLEFKMTHTPDTAKQRYKDLIKRRDIEIYEKHKIRHVDISQLVTDRVLASYLGIIPTHLSNIKKEIIEEERATQSERRTKS